MKDKYKAQEKYQKEKMLTVNTKYKKDFVLEYREALKTLNYKNSDVIREAMQKVIDKAKKK